MRRDGRDHRSWQRRKKQIDDHQPDERAVLRELRRRQLTDLEQCRIAWEHHLDPAAVCQAVIMCDLPEWLKNALLIRLTEGVDGRPQLAIKAWASRRRDDVDKLRVAHVLNARISPKTWVDSFTVAKAELSGNDAQLRAVTGNVDADALKKSYQRVRRGLLSNSGRYFSPDFTLWDKVSHAWAYLRALKKGHQEIDAHYKQGKSHGR